MILVVLRTIQSADSPAKLGGGRETLLQLRNHYDIVTNLLSPSLQHSKRSDY